MGEKIMSVPVEIAKNITVSHKNIGRRLLMQITFDIDKLDFRPELMRQIYLEVFARLMSLKEGYIDA